MQTGGSSLGARDDGGSGPTRQRPASRQWHLCTSLSISTTAAVPASRRAGAASRRGGQRRPRFRRRSTTSRARPTSHPPDRPSRCSPSRSGSQRSSRRVRPSTYDSYARNIRLNVVGHAIGLTLLQQVDAPRLNRFYADLLAGRGRMRALTAFSAVRTRPPAQTLPGCHQVGSADP